MFNMKKLSVACIMISMVFAGFTIMTPAVVAEDPFKPIVQLNDPAGVTFMDVEWHPDGDYAISVGNDSTDGVVYRNDRASDTWTQVGSNIGDKYNGVTYTKPFVFNDRMEEGANGWTNSTWSGNLTWKQVDPVALTVTGTSGLDHYDAHSGNKVWWFGNDTTGDYVDTFGGAGIRVAGNLTSPIINLPSISTKATLSFWHWFQVEGGNYEKMSVHIRNTTGADTGWTQLFYWDGNNNAEFSEWTKNKSDISGWLGNNVQIEFRFDSTDSFNNNFPGWHIDDFSIETNSVFVVAGKDGPAGFSAYSTDGYSALTNISGINGTTFNDVTAGKEGATVLAVGNTGVARYWNNSAWLTISGASTGDTLTGVDFNGTHFFIVGYNTSTNNGVAYYIKESEITGGSYGLHPIPGAPNKKLNDIAWSDNAPWGGSGTGMGIVAAEGNLLGLGDPEIWTNANPSTAPSPRNNLAMVYDSVNNKVVLFGGYDGTFFGDTWTHDVASNTWTNMNPVSAPSPRQAHAMAYDSANNKVVLFGGYDGSYDGETWTYDTASNTWTNMNPVAAAPSPRYYHAMAYDSANNKVVLFGGTDGSYNGETWIYDVANNTWTNMNPATAPPPRASYAMAYDSANNKIVLFGGSGGSYLGDTWTYDTASNTWNNKNPATAPSPRMYHTMAYDSANNKIILFGGNDGFYDGETWTYDTASNTWNNKNPSSAPSAREQHTMAYDSANNKVVLFGGYDDAYDNDTWLGDFSSPWGDKPAAGTNNENFNAVAWNGAGMEALAVGYDSVNSTGVVYRFYAGNGFVAKAPDSSNVLSDHQLYGVAYKPGANAEHALVVGASAFKVQTTAFDDSTQITVNAAFPNLFDVDFYKTGVPAISLTNQPVDVEDNYTFYAEVNYTFGGLDQLFDGVNNTAVRFMVWYDNNGANENTLLTENDMNRTRAFNVTWFEGGIGFPENAIIEYPVASMGTDEFLLTGFNSGPAGGDHWWITIDVSFGPQMRAADGGGFAVGPSGDIKDAGQSFNDPNSWNFMIEVYDINFTSAFDKGFEEFGVNRFTNVTATGNPAGNAPPGSVNISLNPNSNITYASNDRYYVNISVENLVSGPNQILASNLQVRLSSPIAAAADSQIFISNFFGGANIPLSVWGNVLVPLAAPKNGTTSHGPWGSDFNAIGFNYGTEVIWWVTVPAATPEGVYTGQITVTVESY